VKVFLFLTLVMASLAGLLGLSGIFDFTAERGYRKATTCGFLYLFTPEHLQSTRLCIAYNLAPFFVMPALVLLLLVRRLLFGLGGDGR